MTTLKTEKLMTLPESRFCDRLVQCNNLAARGFVQWAFYPGMLFQAPDKWWGDRGLRSSPHEGIDLCLYRDTCGALRLLDKTVQIPAIYTGQIKSVIDDYLGKTLFVAHDMYDSTGNQCYTMYGHAAPRAGIVPGKRVAEGEIIAAIAAAEDSGITIVPHIHLSVAWVPETFPAEQLAWKSMNSRNYIVLVNPLDVLRCSYSIVQ
jgi:hypothetical protein